MVNDEANARDALRIIADSVPIHLLHLDRDERILFANQAAATMWGRRAEEMVGRTIRDVLGEEVQRALQQYSTRVLQGERISYEAAFDAPDGSRRFFLNTYEPVHGADGQVTGFVATGTDITARKQAEDALTRSRESDAAARLQLQEEHTVRERFITTLAHDVRGPLTAAKVSAQLVARSAGDAERVRRLTARITDALDRADGLIRNMLDASAIEQGHVLSLQRQPVELAGFIHSIVDELASVHGDRVRMSPAAELTAAVDGGALRRVIENLVGNAVKYGDPYATITISLSRTGDAAKLEVHNLGPAIPEEEWTTLFEPYRRARSALGGQQKGWGLGLTLVKGLAEAHGGGVTVTSDARSGTTFRVTLPIGAPAADAPADAAR